MTPPRRPAGRLARLLIITLLLSLVGASLVPTAASASPSARPAVGSATPSVAETAAALTQVTITGHGFGHGRGLGQYGAYGYAVHYGQTYLQILAHFYGGTRALLPAAAKGTTLMSTRLTALDGQDARFTVPNAWFLVGNKYRFEAGQVAVLRYSADGTITAYRTTGCFSAAMTKVGVVGNGVVRDSVAAPGNDVNKMLTVCSGANRKSYRGYLTFLSADGTLTGRRLVNTATLDDYLKGVVPREMPASWADASSGRGRQALQAQAVAARSYALTDSHARPYAKTCDTTTCQVYGGAGTNGVLIEDPRSTAAVAATTGRALVNSAGAIVNSEFTASSGGYTVGGTFPAVTDAGDAVAPGGNPYHNWTRSVSTAPLLKAYGSQIGTSVTSMRVTLRDSTIRRALTVRVYGPKGMSDPIPAETFQSLLGLPSTWFYLPS